MHHTVHVKVCTTSGGRKEKARASKYVHHDVKDRRGRMKWKDNSEAS